MGDLAIPVKDMLYGNKCGKDIDRLNFLEGVDCEETGYSEDLKGNSAEEVEQGVKVVDSLRNKSEAWVKFGAGKMVQQIVSTGLRLNLGKFQKSTKRIIINLLKVTYSLALMK